jgi:hypothetical protein
MSIMKRALVLSLAVVLGLTFAGFAQGELHGEWDTSIFIYPTKASLLEFFAFQTEIDVVYEVGGWSFGSYTFINDAGWGQQYFTAAGSFGAFSIDSKLEFVPTGAFVGWYVDTGFIFGSVDIGILFALVPNNVLLELTAGATTGVVDIDITLALGDVVYSACDDIYGYFPYSGPENVCDFNFNGIKIDIDFPFCCADVHADIDFTCYGFDKACFTVSGITVPNLPWVTLTTTICFQTLSKTIAIYPAFGYGNDVCFDLYFETVQTDGSVINGWDTLVGKIVDGWQLVGIGLECEIGGVSFSGISYWGQGFYSSCAGAWFLPSPLSGYAGAGFEGNWEAYKIATTEDGCCGPFDFSLTFFMGGGGQLFDISRIIAAFSYELGANFTFDMGFDYTVGTPGLQKLSIGFEVTW